MAVATIGLDNSKHVFHIHAVDGQGQVAGRDLRTPPIRLCIRGPGGSWAMQSKSLGGHRPSSDVVGASFEKLQESYPLGF